MANQTDYSRSNVHLTERTDQEMPQDGLVDWLRKMISPRSHEILVMEPDGRLVRESSNRKR